jgi:hypothetical protein
MWVSNHILIDDLRLQFSETSAISFAIPYGVPGNPNSKRQVRMGIETRVHNLWVCSILFFLTMFIFFLLKPLCWLSFFSVRVLELEPDNEYRIT